MVKKKNNYWTKDKCQIESLKYSTRSEFAKNVKGAYNSALRNGWLEDICNHMLIQGDLYKRYNYAYEFNDNHVYVGLTCNINRRHKEHMCGEASPVYKHMEITGLSPIFMYDKLKDVKESKKNEIKDIENYLKEGWVLLNKAKGGSVGSTKTNLTKELCQKEAFKFKSRIEFQQNSRSIYRHALSIQILDDICKHMKQKITKELCQKEALKYSSKKEFYTNSQNHYRFCIRNKFLNEICKHMIK